LAYRKSAERGEREREREREEGKATTTRGASEEKKGRNY
jgi:hypothetical protein